MTWRQLCAAGPGRDQTHEQPLGGGQCLQREEMGDSFTCSCATRKLCMQTGRLSPRLTSTHY